VWLKFKGGKGVATGAGAFLAICPPAAGAGLLVWAATVGIWRYVSLGSVAAAAALPILTYALYAPGYAPPAAISGAAVGVAALIIWKHRANFGRIAAGTEPRFKW
jgi:glycerol-3-phosphate acyltransferase PlsY